MIGYDDEKRAALTQAGIVTDTPLKARIASELSLDERVKLGRLAYWDPAYKEKLAIS